jgi:hypothetical protein
MVTKTKKRKTTKSVKSKTQKKDYSVNYLAAALALVLFLEGILAGVAVTTQDSAVALLDVSDAVAGVTESVSYAFEPMIETAVGINNFYVSAANETALLLDSSGYFDLAFISGVYNFYQLASLEMGSLLDASNFATWPAKVSGASTY